MHLFSLGITININVNTVFILFTFNLYMFTVSVAESLSIITEIIGSFLLKGAIINHLQNVLSNLIDFHFK